MGNKTTPHITLINKINSYYITNHILNYIEEKKRLTLIKFNKNIQKNLGIEINYYKKISGKYIIFDENGKGKEYLIETNSLIFNGEYLNRKRNGKGTEYYSDGKIKFEGGYLNGEKHGKGKEYLNYDGRLIYKGEFFEGKRWKGKGKEYEFEGEYFEGKRWNGKGYDEEGNVIYELQDGKGYIIDNIYVTMMQKEREKLN